jgi:hypothetical protein
LSAPLPSVSRLSIKCGSLDVSQSYRPSWPVTGDRFILFFINYLFFITVRILHFGCKASFMTVPAILCYVPLSSISSSFSTLVNYYPLLGFLIHKNITSDE